MLLLEYILILTEISDASLKIPSWHMIDYHLYEMGKSQFIIFIMFESSCIFLARFTVIDK